MPSRLIDLHCDWLLQYASETTVFDPALYVGTERRIGQSVGYLQGTSAAVFSCHRRAEDWKRQPDPWDALSALITRIEAEFPGRLLIGPFDFARWKDDPEGLCWGIVGVEGFDFLIRESNDLDNLPKLFDRGVRVFQPVHSSDNRLAGSSQVGDERGLTALGSAFLQKLVEIPGGPRPSLDLAHMNPVALSEVLDWYEADTLRSERLIPIYSHGALAHEGYDSPRALRRESLVRLRALGGVIGFSVGPPFFESVEALKAGIEAAASLPFRRRMGFEGIAIGTDFLGVDATLPGMGTIDDVVAGLAKTFAPDAAEAVIRGNSVELIKRLTGSTGA